VQVGHIGVNKKQRRVGVSADIFQRRALRPERINQFDIAIGKREVSVGVPFEEVVEFLR